MGFVIKSTPEDLNGYKDIPEEMMQTRPAQASQLIRPNVRILAKIKPAIAATTMNIAVQVPWEETAFSPMDTLNIAEPQTKVQSTVHASA